MTNLPTAARAAQKLASSEARLAEGGSLPYPPEGYPPVPSTDGAKVLGYLVQWQEMRDCYGPEGKLCRPGDAGFLDAQCGRLGLSPMPAGWRFERRASRVLIAMVDGNPILLEQPARALGYPRALADGPNRLNLGEIVED